MSDPRPDQPAARWVVRGRVQGVGFRWYTVRLGTQLGLVGWARNLADGSVEVVAAGPTDRLAELEAGIRNGPRMAHVESVEKTASPHEVHSYNSFTVK